ncbi:MAG TPA: site-specific integrase [Bryobacteraceae bacterium]|nr:site-specific integrase [Bryobacteraceae bacterium]
MPKAASPVGKTKSAPMRGVFERPPGSDIWWINYHDASGHRHRERIGRYSVAVEAYLQRRQEVREGRFTPPRSTAGINFRELAKLGLAYKKMRLTPRSYVQDVSYSRVLNGVIGDVAINTITPRLIEETLQAFREKGLSGSTANRYRSFLSTVFAFGVHTGRMGSNPCAKVAQYRENPPRVRFLLPEEETRLRKVIQEQCPERMEELDLALNTGIRRGEQFSLLRENVNLEQGVLTVQGKTGRRHVPINSAARKALEVLLSRAAGPNLIPEYTEAGRLDWRRWLEDCIVWAKIQNFTWHDLRHTFASRLVMAGVDIRTVQELMGHKSILMTMRYAHLAPSHTKAAVEKIVPGAPETARTGNLRVVAGTQMAPKKAKGG